MALAIVEIDPHAWSKPGAHATARALGELVAGSLAAPERAPRPSHATPRRASERVDRSGGPHHREGSVRGDEVSANPRPQRAATGEVRAETLEPSGPWPSREGPGVSLVARRAIVEGPLPEGPITTTARADADLATRGVSPSVRAPASLPARERARTSRGGLLFVLHVVAALRVPERVATDAALSARSLRWALHALARLLCPMAPDDAAALAFAGVPPDAGELLLGEPPGSEDEVRALEDIAGCIREATHARLESLGLSREATMAWLCRRDAWIVADPGWIEATFSLDDVSVAVRRAGLDLHPDWLPWLGVVVRFVYA